MQVKDSELGNNDKDRMPIELGIKNQTNEIIYQSNVDENMSDTSSIEPFPNRSDDSINDSYYDRDLRKEYGSTGAYEEYTASREENVKSNIKPKENEKQSYANMNVEGMPWFYEEPSKQEMQQRHAHPELSRRETRRLIMSSLLAALAIAGVFIGGIFLFLLFATKVWF